MDSPYTATYHFILGALDLNNVLLLVAPGRNRKSCDQRLSCSPLSMTLFGPWGLTEPLLKQWFTIKTRKHH